MKIFKIFIIYKFTRDKINENKFKEVLNNFYDGSFNKQIR